RSDGGPPLVLVSANAFWNIANFRSGLIDALVERGYRVLVAAPDLDPAWAAARGAESVAIAMDRSGLNPFRDLLLLIGYHRLIRCYRPSFFLGFTVKPNIYGSIAARFARCASIPNVSGLGTAFINPGPLSSLVAMLYRTAFRACPVVFFQNQDDREMFVARKIVRPDQARLLPGSGVDLDHFQPQPEAGGVRFLYVGRLLGDKGVREFVEAARMLRSDKPAWRFQLLGPVDEGNRSSIGRVELDRWVADGSIEYLGETGDVRPHLAGATAVVLPSYREGLPRSLLEAAAMARPMVATDVPGNRQLVRDGINGLLCRPRDPQSLAGAMRRMGDMEPDERAAMGRAARELVEREYDERLVIAAYLDALEQLAPAAGVG
ncbi:MAG TPA: glycosyltransferase family 4 protein, partial [Sphingomicrobium sp.]|nr:glycosyltransferase family 4 protein [Sphingomicrobium sp.]